MRIRLKELQGRMADRGNRVSLTDIAEGTGINPSGIFDISTGRIKLLRPEHIDALCVYFGVNAGELIEAEPVTIPLPPIRPDRRGAKVGEKTKEAKQ